MPRCLCRTHKMIARWDFPEKSMASVVLSGGRASRVKGACVRTVLSGRALVDVPFVISWCACRNRKMMIAWWAFCHRKMMISWRCFRCKSHDLTRTSTDTSSYAIILWYRPSCSIVILWFVQYVYDSQTKVWKGWTKDEMRNFIPPKRRFWKEEQKMKSWFSKHFSRAWVLDLGYEPLKSQSKIWTPSLVRPSKIFVWGA
jgi:hypothetical protein